MAQLRSGLRLKEQEVEKIGQVASKLTQERDSVSDVVRQEFADRYVNMCVCLCVGVIAPMHACVYITLRKFTTVAPDIKHRGSKGEEGDIRGGGGSMRPKSV